MTIEQAKVLLEQITADAGDSVDPFTQILLAIIEKLETL